MIEQQAVVIAVHGAQADVSVQRRTACGACEQSDGCSTSVLAGLFKQRDQLIRVDNPIGAEPGDRVILGIEEYALQIASLIVYLLPILGLIVGAAIGSLLGTEPLSIALGLLGLTIGLFWARSVGRSSDEHPGYRVRITRNRSRPGIQIETADLGIRRSHDENA